MLMLPVGHDGAFSGTWASAQADPSAVVGTVPASFQFTQANETVAAASHASFDLLKTQLLDEPLAAFVDFLAAQPPRLSIAPGTSCNLLVFDSGGGTRDIAFLSLTRVAGGQLAVAYLRQVARSHGTENPRSRHTPQAPLETSKRIRLPVRPSRPITFLTCSSSLAIRALADTIT